MTQSAKGLFKALRPKIQMDHRQDALAYWEQKAKPKEARRDHDHYPTGETDAIRALLARDGDRIRSLGAVWEPACGAGAMVKVIRSEGIPCSASDLIDRGCPDSWTADYYTCLKSRGGSIITNPPYDQITARDGHGRWLRHTLNMSGWRYLALLLSWDWPAGRINGFAELLDSNPFSYCYLCRWKIDFTGEGQAPQRNAWFVWDRDDVRTESGFRLLDRVDARQGALF